MLKMLYARCPGPSPPISVQFILKMCVAAGNCKKINKNPLFWGFRVSQVHRRWHQ